MHISLLMTNVKSNSIIIICFSQPNKSPGRAAAPSSGIEILDNPSILECEFGSNSNVFLFSRESQEESIGQEQEVWLCCEQAGKGGGRRWNPKKEILQKGYATRSQGRAKIIKRIQPFDRWFPRSRQRRRRYQKAAPAPSLQRARSTSTRRASLKWTIRWVSPWPSWPRRSRRARRRRRRKVQSLRRRSRRVRDRRRDQGANQRRLLRCSVAVEAKTQTHHSSGIAGFHLFLQRFPPILFAFVTN